MMLINGQQQQVYRPVQIYITNLCRPQLIQYQELFSAGKCVTVRLSYSKRSLMIDRLRGSTTLHSSWATATVTAQQISTRSEARWILQLL